MFFIKWHCFAGPSLAVATKNGLRLLLVVTAGAVALGMVSTALATYCNDSWDRVVNPQLFDQF